MYYELMNKNLGLPRKAECIFCGKSVSWNDYYCLCREHGNIYKKIPKILRLILPKFIIWKYIKRV